MKKQNRREIPGHSLSYSSLLCLFIAGCYNYSTGHTAELMLIRVVLLLCKEKKYWIIMWSLSTLFFSNKRMQMTVLGFRCINSTQCMCQIFCVPAVAQFLILHLFFEFLQSRVLSYKSDRRVLCFWQNIFSLLLQMITPNEGPQIYFYSSSRKLSFKQRKLLIVLNFSVWSDLCFPCPETCFFKVMEKYRPGDNS